MTRADLWHLVGGVAGVLAIAVIRWRPVRRSARIETPTTREDPES